MSLGIIYGKMRTQISLTLPLFFYKYSGAEAFQGASPTEIAIFKRSIYSVRNNFANNKLILDFQ
jgi:hypothetical protein